MLNERIEKSIDLIFDNNSFDVEELLNYVKKGKLSHRDTKTKRKTSGFQGDIETLVTAILALYPTRRVEKVNNASEEPMLPKSFSQLQGHFIVEFMNAVHGAGATTTVYNLARCYAMHGYKTCIADLSGTVAVKLIKVKVVYGFLYYY